MDLTKTYLDLVKESAMFRNYKRMSLVCAILSAIVVIPFIIQYVALMLVYGLLIILYKLISSPVDYLLGFVKGEGNQVQHATQAVIYFIGFPFIFFMKVLLSIVVFVIAVLHFVVSVIGYIASLGGISFSPFVLNPVDRTKEKKTPAYSSTPLAMFIVFGLFLLFLFCFFRPIANSLLTSILDYDAWEFNLGGTIVQYNAFELYYRFVQVVATINLCITVSFVTFVVIYVLTFFRRNSKKNDELLDDQAVELCDANDIN